MTTTKRNVHVTKLVISGVCLAIAMFLPFLTGQIPQIGSMLSPMHIPAFLCGFLCGWPYALVVGAVAPLLRSLIFGMPPLFPIALCMAFEMAAYGVAAALLQKALPQKPLWLYVQLAGAMLAGRAVWGVAAAVFYPLAGAEFGISIFLMSAFVKAVPGIICHFILVPPVVLACRKAGLGAS